MSDPSSAVALSPFVEALSPLVNAAVSGLVIGVGGLIFAALARWTGVAFTPDFQSQVERAAATQAGIIVAKAEGNLAGKSIEVGNPAVAAATNWIAANMPAALDKAGVNRDDVSHLILAEIGKLQAQMAAPTPAATTTARATQ